MKGEERVDSMVGQARVGKKKRCKRKEAERKGSVTKKKI